VSSCANACTKVGWLISTAAAGTPAAEKNAGVAVLHFRPLDRGDRGLEERDALRARSGVLRTGEREHLPDVGEVLLAEGRIDLVRFQVIVAVGHRQPALRENADVTGGVARVLRHVVVERHPLQQALRLAEEAHDIRVRQDLADAREARLERREARRVDRRLVHEARVEVADFLAVGAGSMIGALRGLPGDGAHVLLRALIEDRECAPTRAVLGNGRVAQPFAARE